MSRRNSFYFALFLLSVFTSSLLCGEETKAKPPNFVIIFADDLGYGDLSCYGNPTIQTPNLDRMAAEGTRLTQFYSAASVCTPSRAALLTGRLPQRIGMYGDKRRVLFPDSKNGLPANEITIAESLKGHGYRTACIGKWHLGHLPDFQPRKHSFDYFFGLPYSNDMDRVAEAPKGNLAFEKPMSEYWNVPLMRNEDIVERPANQSLLSKKYGAEAKRFVEECAGEPFFLYWPQTFPHVPLFSSEDFAGKSRRGLYGDVVEELDHEVGLFLDYLRESGLDKSTYVIFTSDNGPWLSYREQGGSAGPLRDGKGCTFEGGMREPAIFWGPGRIPAGRVSAELGSTLDLFATIHGLAELPIRSDTAQDSFDLSGFLKGERTSPRNEFFYYRGSELMAARVGAWKAHFFTQSAYGANSDKRTKQDPPQLFNLEHDLGEKENVAGANPAVLEEIIRSVERHRSGMKIVPSLLD